MPRGPLGFPRLTSIGPFTEEEGTLDKPPSVPTGFSTPEVRNLRNLEATGYEWNISLVSEYLTDLSAFEMGPNEFRDRPNDNPHPTDGVAGMYVVDYDTVWVTNRAGHHHMELISILMEAHDIELDGKDVVLFRSEYTTLDLLNDSIISDLLGINVNGASDTEIAQAISSRTVGDDRAGLWDATRAIEDTFIASIDVPALPFGDTIFVNDLRFEEITTEYLYKCIYASALLGMPPESVVGYKHQPRSKATNPEFYHVSHLYHELENSGLLPEPLVDRSSVRTMVLDDVDQLRGNLQEIL